MKRLFCLVVLFFLPYSAQANEVKDFLTKVLEDVISISRSQISESQKKERIKSVLTPNIDTKYITKFVLGTHWRNLTPEQRQGFFNMYQVYLQDVYTKGIVSFSTNDKFGFEVSKLSPIDATYTNVTVNFSFLNKEKKKVEFPVDFKVKKNENAYQIMDFAIENISFLESQRSQFDSIIQKDGFEKLMEFLESKTRI